MKKTFALILVACFALACKTAGPAATSTSGSKGAKPAKANPVVVVVDVERIMKEAKLAKGLQEELKTWAEGMQGQLRTRAEEIQKAEAAKSKPAKEIDAQKQELFQMQQMAKQEFQGRQESAADRMKKAFDPLMQTLAKENGWDVILNKNEQVTIFASDAIDQTDFVIQSLDAAPAPAPAAPAPEGTPQPKP